uniref:Uncharacterized protein n=1 Tax=Romanomermis culicivorax TaxID=13658 RepID=A0A915I2B1_ROMCU
MTESENKFGRRRLKSHPFDLKTIGKVSSPEFPPIYARHFSIFRGRRAKKRHDLNEPYRNSMKNGQQHDPLYWSLPSQLSNDKMTPFAMFQTAPTRNEKRDEYNPTNLAESRKNMEYLLKPCLTTTMLRANYTSPHGAERRLMSGCYTPYRLV